MREQQVRTILHKSSAGMFKDCMLLAQAIALTLVSWLVTAMQVVGFEVMACSIKRKAGARVEPLSCVGNDDRPPEPQEVTKGQCSMLPVDSSAHSCLGGRGCALLYCVLSAV